jgi:hypothetical protein
MDESKMSELKVLLNRYPELNKDEYTRLAELLDEKMGYDD